jgi:hypothetical protein
VSVLRLAFVLAAALPFLLAACSSSPPPRAATAPAPPSTAPAPSAARTTAPPATTVQPPTTEALIPQESPEIAARALFDAWSKGDRVGALHVATPAAVAALFAHPVASYSDRGCQDPISDRALCAFGLGGGLAQVGTVSLAGGWVVETVTLE